MTKKKTKRTRKRSKKVACPQCGKRFVERGLRLHMRTHATEAAAPTETGNTTPEIHQLTDGELAHSLGEGPSLPEESGLSAATAAIGAGPDPTPTGGEPSGAAAPGMDPKALVAIAEVALSYVTRMMAARWKVTELPAELTQFSEHERAAMMFAAPLAAPRMSQVASNPNTGLVIFAAVFGSAVASRSSKVKERRPAPTNAAPAANGGEVDVDHESRWGKHASAVQPGTKVKRSGFPAPFRPSVG